MSGYNPKRYTTEKRARICVMCHSRRASVGILCASCSLEHNAVQNSRYLSARAGGQCDDCGAPSPTAARCPDCRDRRKRHPSRQANYRAARGGRRFA